MKNIRLVLLLVLAVTLTFSQGYAAPPPQASQEMGGIERTRELEARAKRLTAEIQQKKKKPGIEEANLPKEAAPV